MVTRRAWTYPGEIHSKAWWKREEKVERLMYKVFRIEEKARRLNERLATLKHEQRFDCRSINCNQHEHY